MAKIKIEKWEKIESDYVYGTMSLRELAKAQDVSFSFLSKKAAENQWYKKRTDYRSTMREMIQQQTTDLVVDAKLKNAEIAQDIDSIILKEILDRMTQRPEEADSVDLQRYHAIANDYLNGQANDAQTEITVRFADEGDDYAD